MGKLKKKNKQQGRRQGRDCVSVQMSMSMSMWRTICHVKTERTYTLRRWFLCPYLCQRAGPELAPPLVPAPQDSLRSSQSTLGVGLQISSKDSLSTGAWRLEEGPEIEQLGQCSSIFVGLRAWRASVPLPADNHRICDPSRSVDPTKPGFSPHHFSGAKKNHDTSVFSNLRCNAHV